MSARAALKDQLKINVSVNDMIIKAAALSLRDVPEVNGNWSKGEWKLVPTVDISVAVATPTGLITPIVTGADKRGLVSINSAVGCVGVGSGVLGWGVWS